MSAAELLLNEVLEAYDFGNPVVGAARYGCGHINDTFCVHTQPVDDCCDCFILQRMSAAAFKHPDQLMSNVVEVKSRGASVLGVAAESRAEAMAKTADHIISIPDTHPMLLPSLEVIPLQLFAYYVALMRGCDIDKPRNLAKSVTVE